MRVILSLAFATLLACSDAKPSQEDQRREALLEQQYGAEYDFRLEDVYIVATRRSGEPTHREAAAISKAFWSDTTGQLRSDTTMTYLNMHGPAGFQFQAYYDRKSGELKFATTEHY